MSRTWKNLLDGLLGLVLVWFSLDLDSIDRNQSTSDTKVVAAASQVNCNYALIFIYGIYLPPSKAPKYPSRKLTKREL